MKALRLFCIFLERFKSYGTSRGVFLEMSTNSEESAIGFFHDVKRQEFAREVFADIWAVANNGCHLLTHF